MPKTGIRFLYYFCLCKSFKELLLQCLAGSVSRLAGAKVRLFSEPTKLFREKIHLLSKIHLALDQNQDT